MYIAIRAWLFLTDYICTSKTVVLFELIFNFYVLSTLKRACCFYENKVNKVYEIIQIKCNNST